MGPSVADGSGSAGLLADGSGSAGLLADGSGSTDRLGGCASGAAQPPRTPATSRITSQNRRDPDMCAPAPTIVLLSADGVIASAKTEEREGTDADSDGDPGQRRHACLVHRNLAGRHTRRCGVQAFDRLDRQLQGVILETTHGVEA